MKVENTGFDDFVDDCFIDEDPICKKSSDASLELVASQIISELLTEDESGIAA